jgi:hypothetical protein
MHNTYTWVIPELECYPQKDGFSDVVFMIHWKRELTDDVHTVDVYGTQAVALDPEAPFTPFDQITKAQVEGWLEGAMGAEKIAEINDILDEQIQHRKNPPIVRPALPWA